MPFRAATAAFVAAVAAGIAWLYASGAPAAYAAVNAGALLLGVVAAAVIQRTGGKALDIAALWLAPAAMAASIALGPEVDGVHRWIAAGPIRLHAAALFGPLLVLSFHRKPDWQGAAAAVITAALAALQPDLATTLALTCALGGGLAFDLRPPRMLAFIASAGALGLAIARPDSLAAVPFVEHVLQDMFGAGGLLGPLAALCLAVAITAPVIKPAGGSSDGIAVMGWFVGLVAASLLAPFPTPLVGYGAAPIIGYALGIGLLRRGPAKRSPQT